MSSHSPPAESRARRKRAAFGETSQVGHLHRRSSSRKRAKNYVDATLLLLSSAEWLATDSLARPLPLRASLQTVTSPTQPRSAPRWFRVVGSGSSRLSHLTPLIHVSARLLSNCCLL